MPLDLEAQRQRLLQERQRLENELRSFDVDIIAEPEIDPGYSNHMADDAPLVFEQTKNLALRNNAERMLEQVNHALGRLDRGEYGTCEVCGRPILEERLEALPWATLCIEDQQKRERQHRGALHRVTAE